MEAFVQQVAVVAGILALMFAGPALALAFLLFRKRRARLLRRSPLTSDLLRGPGHTVREQLDDADSDLMADLFALMALPPVVLALFLAQSSLSGLQAVRPLMPLYVVVTLAFLGFMIRRLWKAAARRDRLRAGLDAELAVGQRLDQLMRQGAFVFHDLPADKFNVDHVVVSGEGVFAVETKGFTKPNQAKGKAGATVVFDGKTLSFPTWTGKSPLEQAERQSRWLSKWLTSAAGFDVAVVPVLALPGWFVDRTGRGTTRVFNDKELAGLLQSRGAQRLSAQQVQCIAHQIEQRCRTVAPRFAVAKSSDSR